jgi:hypothetical protein
MEGCISTDEQESEIQEHVLFLKKLYFGLTPAELRGMVFEFALRNRKKECFP